MTTYAVNDIFYSLQGEGMRVGQASVFLRFAGCNLKCAGEIVDQAYQPVCDTEFVSSRQMDCNDIVAAVNTLLPTNERDQRWVIFTGGEPALQLDAELVDSLRHDGCRLAIETNGTIDVSGFELDWVCVSPKVAEHNIKQLKAHEVKYVRNFGQGIPKTVVDAYHYLISPAWDEGGFLSQLTLDWCIKLCKDNPQWALTMQLHKLIAIR